LYIIKYDSGLNYGSIEIEENGFVWSIKSLYSKMCM
jgi:hypothetical protein